MKRAKSARTHHLLFQALDFEMPVFSWMWIEHYLKVEREALFVCLFGWFLNALVNY